MSIVDPPVRAPASVALYGVTWKAYCRLREKPENRHLRMTFDRGRLELMSPSRLHERVAYLIGRMVDAWTDENGIDAHGCRTMTFQRQDLDRGLEPDNCFYLQNESLVRDREELDLSRDPPPDLVIEVDLTSPSRRRLPLYQSLRVPEVWVWRDDALMVHVLAETGSYEERVESTVLPGFPIPAAVQLLGQRQAMSDTELSRRYREIIRS